MKIFSIRNKKYCKTKIGFSFYTLETVLDETLHMKKESFAHHYSMKIFRALFQNALDLRQEYQDYYVEEYESFERFLYQKKLWNPNDIRQLNLNQDQTVLELSPIKYSYNIDNLLDYGESGIDIINKTLEDISL
ncbi:MAG: hypothetical protein AB9835_10385 [Eubacteriales bacterium]